MTWYLFEIWRTGNATRRPNSMTSGSKNGWTDIPVAINVLTFVQRLDKKMPGFEAAYNSLSEYAHPNWHQVSGLYSKSTVKTSSCTMAMAFEVTLLAKK